MKKNFKNYLNIALRGISCTYNFIYKHAKPIHYSIFLHLCICLIALTSTLIYVPKFTPQQTIVVDLVQLAKNTNIERKEKKTVKNSRIQTKASVQKKVVEKPKKVVNKKKVIQQEKKKELPQNNKSIIKVADKKQSNKTPVKPTEAHAKKQKVIDKKSGESVLKSVEKNRITRQNAKDNKDIKTNKEATQSKLMTLDEKEALRAQIVRHWNASAWSGANLKLMEIILRIKLDKQGNVISIKEISSHNSSNKNFIVFKQSVENAIRRSSPLNNLPADKFEQWNEVEVKFTPRDMIY